MSYSENAAEIRSLMDELLNLSGYATGMPGKRDYAYSYGVLSAVLDSTTSQENTIQSLKHIINTIKDRIHN